MTISSYSVLDMPKMTLLSICCSTMLGLIMVPTSAATTTRCTLIWPPWIDTSATWAR